MLLELSFLTVLSFHLFHSGIKAFSKRERFVYVIFHLLLATGNCFASCQRVLLPLVTGVYLSDCMLAASMGLVILIKFLSTREFVVTEVSDVILCRKCSM